MEKLLHTGDTVRLKKGMTVLANIPQRFVFETMSNETQSVFIKIGDILERCLSEETLLREISTSIQISSGIRVEKNKLRDFLASLDINFEETQFDTSIYEGTYVVTNAYDAGKNKYLPDDYGWHVCCTMVDNPSISVQFYQTGILATISPEL